MKKIYSNIDHEKLLHIVYHPEAIEKRLDIAPENQFLQAAIIKLPQGTKFRAHKHIWKDVFYDKLIAQESWIVMQGAVKVFYYDIDDTLLTTEIIRKGDCSMTFEGGHNYEILEDDTVVYEFKTGPYKGQVNDKQFIGE
jgi:hypothetical protein